MYTMSYVNYTSIINTTVKDEKKPTLKSTSPKKKNIIKANPNIMEIAKFSKVLNSISATVKSEQIVLEFQVYVLFSGRERMPLKL